MTVTRHLRPFHATLVIAAVAGALTVRWIPTDWFLNFVVVSFGLGVFLAILLHAQAKDEKPLDLPAKVFSSVVLGTSKPKAVIQENAWTRFFVVVVCFDVSMLLAMLAAGIIE